MLTRLFLFLILFLTFSLPAAAQHYRPPMPGLPACNTDGYVLTWDTTDHAYQCEASQGGGGTPGGANSQVQINCDGEFCGYSDLVYDYVQKILTGHIIEIKSPDGTKKTRSQTRNDGSSLETACDKLVCVGDSNTLGGTPGPGADADRWCDIIAAELGCSSFEVRADNGLGILDAAVDKIFPFVPVSGEIYVQITGNGDVLFNGDNADAKENYKRVQTAIGAWLETQQNFRDMNASGWTCDAGTDATRFTNLDTKTLDGAEESCSRTILGTTIYVGIVAGDADCDETRIEIDGVVVATIDNCVSKEGNPVLANGTRVPQAFRFAGLENKAHTVEIFNATGGKETEIAFVSSNHLIKNDSPTWVLGGAIDIDDYVVGAPSCDCADDDDMLAYREIDFDISAQFRTDDLNVIKGDADKGYDVATMGYGDLIHRNDAGHRQIANNVEDALSMNQRAGNRQPIEILVKDIRTGEIKPKNPADFIAATVGDNTVSTAKLQNNAVTQPKASLGTGVGDANSITLHDFISGSPSTGHTVQWNGTNWIPVILPAPRIYSVLGANLTCSAPGVSAFTAPGYVGAASASGFIGGIVTAGTVSDLRVKLPAGNVPASETLVITVMKNVAATAVTCSIAAGSSSCEDTTNSATFVTGDILAFLMTCSGGTTPVGQPINMSVKYQ